MVIQRLVFFTILFSVHILVINFCSFENTKATQDPKPTDMTSKLAISQARYDLQSIDKQSCFPQRKWLNFNYNLTFACLDPSK